jgi:hypothetical protein
LRLPHIAETRLDQAKNLMDLSRSCINGHAKGRKENVTAFNVSEENFATQEAKVKTKTWKEPIITRLTTSVE